MNIKNFTQNGFSAVELVITLFIAAIFLIGGYQIATYVLRSGTESEQFAKASTLAHEYLRRYSVSTDQCSSSTLLNNQSLSASESGSLVNATVTVSRSCPNADIPTLSKITSTVSYKSSTSTSPRSVTHAIFIN